MIDARFGGGDLLRHLLGADHFLAVEVASGALSYSRTLRLAVGCESTSMGE
jgi:hypothetical protein